VIDSSDGSMGLGGPVLTLCVGSTWLAIPTEAVVEVAAPRDVTPVPLCPDYVPGIMGLRRTVLPLLDLARFLGLSAGEEGAPREVGFPRVAVVAAAGMRVGILCDQVRGIVSPAPEDLRRTDLARLGRLGEFATAVFETARALVVVVDPVALLEAARLR
jgi:purine-binding chemotaxis protein CheW